MGRKFVDLHVFSNLSIGSSSISEIAKVASNIGFKYIGIADFNRSNINMIGEVRKVFYDYGLDMVSRVDLLSNDVEVLKKDLTFFRGKVEVIAVFCSNLSVARFAARDSRVDILLFSYSDWKKNFFDISEARLAVENEAAYEINITDLIRCSTINEMIKTLRIMSENIKIALKYGVPIIVSSGAKSIYELREPRAMASIANLLGISEFDALKCISDIPLNLITNNRDKLCGKLLYKGVRLLGKSGGNHEAEKK